MPTRRATILVAPLALYLGAPAAHAQRNDTFRFAWVRGAAAEHCPSEREMTERVKVRLGRDPFDDAAPRVIEGSVTRADGQWLLELRVRDENGALLGERSLGTSGDDCTSLAEAGTLAVVLTIDPNASHDEAAARALAAPPPKPPLPAPAPPPCPPIPKAAPPPPCPSCAQPGVEISLSAHALGAAGSLPRVAAGVQLGGELGWRSVRFGAGAYFVPSVAHQGGHMSFGLTSAVLSGCAGIAGPLELCGVVDAGVLRVSADVLAPVEPGEYPWLAAGLGPRVGFDAAENLRLELAGVVLAPLARHRFVVRGLNEEFQASPVGGRLLLGARLH
jgi:hypothetical protein